MRIAHVLICGLAAALVACGPQTPEPQGDSIDPQIGSNESIAPVDPQPLTNTGVTANVVNNIDHGAPAQPGWAYRPITEVGPCALGVMTYGDAEFMVATGYDSSTSSMVCTITPVRP